MEGPIGCRGMNLVANLATPVEPTPHSPASHRIGPTKRCDQFHHIVDPDLFRRREEDGIVVLAVFGSLPQGCLETNSPKKFPLDSRELHMTAFLDSLWYALPFVDPPPVVRVTYPEGAYIPPSLVETRAVEATVMEGAKFARPVMDAGLAQSHNESMFIGALSWGPYMGVGLVIFAWLWTRWQRS